MDALSMIDTGTQVSEIAAPAKPAGKSDQEFGRVLEQKQQPEKKQVEKPASTDQKQDAGRVETAHTSKRDQAVDQSEKPAKAQQKAVQAELANETEVETNPQPQVQVQHTLVELVDIIANGEFSENAEASGKIEAMLTDLVQQLESTELQGEQQLAGIDVSALVEELQSLDPGSDRAELLDRLVTQVETQLSQGEDLLKNAELAAAMMAEPQQQDATPVAPESLVQARQILQKAIDAVVAQKTAGAEATVSVETGAAEGQSAEETLFLLEDAAEEIDPRFAGLLKPRTENRSAQQAQAGQKAQKQVQENRSGQHMTQTEGEVSILPEVGLEQNQSTETGQLTGGTAKQVMENLVHQAQRNYQSLGQPQVQSMEMNKAMPQTPVVQLTSGQQVTEGQIFDQVVTHISGSFNGESGRMVLRLQPAELGSLKLELMVEGDRVRANLHAQSTQVQEVLERNLPQLRNALAEQGLKIDQFQVNIDQRQQGGQFENLSQQQQNKGFAQQQGRHHNTEPEEQMIPLAHLMQNGGGGISLHV